jgi:hypothetical protein
MSDTKEFYLVAYNVTRIEVYRIEANSPKEADENALLDGQEIDHEESATTRVDTIWVKPEEGEAA